MTKRLCPHCQKSIEVVLHHDITVSFPFEEGGDWRAPLATREIEVIERAKATGILEAFEAAVTVIKKENLPRVIQHFFLHFLRTLSPVVVPRKVLYRYAAEFGGRIEFRQSQGVACVLSDQILRQFVHLEILTGQRVRKRDGKVAAVLDVDEGMLDDVIRTKFGYIPKGKANFLDYMRKRSIGEFVTKV